MLACFFTNRNKFAKEKNLKQVFDFALNIVRNKSTHNIVKLRKIYININSHWLALVDLDPTGGFQIRKSNIRKK